MKTLVTLLAFLTFILVACKKQNVSIEVKPIAEVSIPIDTLHRQSKIVIIGSSTAAGNGAAPIDSCWAKRFQSLYKNLQVTNLAVPGYFTYNVMPTGETTLQRPDPDTLHNISRAIALRPDLVLMSFPTNDIAQDYTDEEIIRNYSRLISPLNIAGIKYLILGTQPRNFTSLEKRTRLKILNDKLKALYPSNYYDYLASVSTATYEVKPELSAGDGIHLNNKGHNIILTGLLTNSLIKKLAQ